MNEIRKELRRPMYYNLDADGKPIPVKSIQDVVHLLHDDNKRTVAKTHIEVPDCFVSTVFIPIDHNFFGEGPPMLWETMVFGLGEDEEQWRYTSREDAKAHHDKVVEAIQKGWELPDPE